MKHQFKEFRIGSARCSVERTAVSFRESECSGGKSAIKQEQIADNIRQHPEERRNLDIFPLQGIYNFGYLSGVAFKHRKKQRFLIKTGNVGNSVERIADINFRFIDEQGELLNFLRCR